MDVGAPKWYKGELEIQSFSVGYMKFHELLQEEDKLLLLHNVLFLTQKYQGDVWPNDSHSYHIDHMWNHSMFQAYVLAIEYYDERFHQY